MRIKKLVIYFMPMLLLFSFTGCMFKYKFKLEQALDKIVKIEIIFVDEDETMIIKELSTEERNNFLSEFLELICYKYWNDPSSTIGGDAVKISYSNGDYEIISSSAQAYYTGDNCHFGREYFNKESFDNILSRYVDQG